MKNMPTLERAVLEALAYSDIFDYPLRLDELHRYLPVRAEMDELSNALKSLNGRVGRKEDFYFLEKREAIVEIRKGRAARSKKLLPVALKYGRALGSFPFVRMVALTGSLAVGNVSEQADLDYMLITAPGRLWTARAFAVTFGRIMRPFGHVICVNLLVTENALAWNRRDLYTARELYQMIPITGLDVYRRLMQVNPWAERFLPNAFMDSGGLPPFFQKQSSGFQNLLELPLRGKSGDRFEQWTMKLQMKRIARRPGAGEETIFTADVCQGNFHHHRKWTHEIFQEKLAALTRQHITSKERIREFVESAAKK